MRMPARSGRTAGPRPAGAGCGPRRRAKRVGIGSAPGDRQRASGAPGRRRVPAQRLGMEMERASGRAGWGPWRRRASLITRQAWQRHRRRRRGQGTGSAPLGETPIGGFDNFAHNWCRPGAPPPVMQEFRHQLIAKPSATFRGEIPHREASS